MKLEGERHRDTTQVKGLSPEIAHHLGGRYRSCGSRQNTPDRNGVGCECPTGSKTVSRCQRADINSGEPKYPQSLMSMRQQVLKDKELQTAFRQSDYPIVSGKSAKADGEKGIATVPACRQDRQRGIGDTSAAHRGGAQRIFFPNV